MMKTSPWVYICQVFLLQYLDFSSGQDLSQESIEEKHHVRHKRSGHDFTYDMKGRYGPPNWKKTWKECDGYEQSPINLREDKAEILLYRVKFIGMTKTHKGVFINNGHAPTFQLSDTGSIMTGLPCFRREKFRLHQFHFHFRHGEHDGTEHEMEGVKYAAELHMVHYNVKYGSFVKAVDKYDGLAVLAVLMEVKDVHDDGREVFDHFIKDFGSKILDPSNHGTHCSFNPFDIVPKYHNFFYYKGSLTTPGCYQSVHWLIFKEKIFIKPKTLKVFRDMRTKHGEPISKRGNIRPVQPLFMRHLLINFFPKKPKKEFSTYPCMDLRATTEFKLDFPYV